MVNTIRAFWFQEHLTRQVKANVLDTRLVKMNDESLTVATPMAACDWPA